MVQFTEGSSGTTTSKGLESSSGQMEEFIQESDTKTRCMAMGSWFRAMGRPMKGITKLIKSMAKGLSIDLMGEFTADSEIKGSSMESVPTQLRIKLKKLENGSTGRE